MIEGEVFPERADGAALLLEVDAAAEVALRIDADGRAEFLDLSSGELLAAESLTSTAGARLTVVAEDSAGTGLFAAGFADGEILVTSWNAASPGLEFPFGRQSFQLPDDEPVRALALRTGQGRVGIRPGTH